MKPLLTLTDLTNLEEAVGIVFPDSFKAFASSTKSWDAQFEKRFPYGQFLRAPVVWKKFAEVLTQEGTPFFINFSEQKYDSSFRNINLEDLEVKTDTDLYVRIGRKNFFLDIYIFGSNPSSREPKVQVFSVHTIVHEWENFSDWLAKELSADLKRKL